MKQIKLTKGFLVEDWTGKIEEIKYFKMDYVHYGIVEERFFMINKEGQMLEPITRYNSDKVFDNEDEAIKHSEKVKKERVEYCEKEIKRYQQKIDELMEKSILTGMIKYKVETR